ncbi:MAG: PAS domain S-box protein [Desulfosalsimonas sp.]|uniref:PAS domain-containing sensor histidine kinase n=1 Tax=Desulfosalsimonas sp. TaxID=3073848 RepID=UPI00397048BA
MSRGPENTKEHRVSRPSADLRGFGPDSQKGDESSRLLEAIFANTHFMVAHMDTNFCFIRVNQAYAKADGKWPDYYKGRNHFDLYPNEENQTIFQKVVDTGQSYYALEKPFEYCQNPERGVSYWDWSLNPVKAADGRVTGLILALVNVTRRKLAQKAALEAEKRFRVMTEAIDDVFWMALPGLKRILYVSPSYEKMWGRSCQSVYESPMSFVESIDFRDRPRVRQRIKHYSGGTWDEEYRVLRPDGSICWVRDRGYPVCDENGGLQMIVGVCTDISGLKSAQRALQTSEGRIRLLSSQLMEAQEKERKYVARELHDSLGSGLAGIKIQIENALAAARFSKTAVAPSVLEGLAANAGDLLAECRRIQKGLRPPMLDDLGLLSTLDWYCRQFNTVFPNIRVEKIVMIDEHDISESLKIVIYRVVQEAMNNAARHGNAGSIQLSLIKNGQYLLLTVADNGIGFSAEKQARADAGYGLLGMKERVELSGGTFRVESRPGRGVWIKAGWQCADQQE